MKKIALIIILIFIAVAFGYTPSYLSFNTGQVSPLLEARADFQKYSSSCRIVENFFASVQGPVSRRPGTKYVADTNDAAVARLISFEYSTDDAYVLEFSSGFIRFFRDSGD